MPEKVPACERESLCAEVEKLDSEREAGHGRGKLGMGERSWEWERKAGHGRGKLGMGEEILGA